MKRKSIIVMILVFFLSVIHVSGFEQDIQWEAADEGESRQMATQEAPAEGFIEAADEGLVLPGLLTQAEGPAKESDHESLNPEEVSVFTADSTEEGIAFEGNLAESASDVGLAAAIIGAGSESPIESLTWRLEGDRLIIYGAGAMEDYDLGHRPPWSDYGGEIREVLISDGVTKIGELAFSSCVNLYSAQIPESVKEIGGDAFSFAGSLTGEKSTESEGLSDLEMATPSPEGLETAMEEAFIEMEPAPDSELFIDSDLTPDLQTQSDGTTVTSLIFYGVPGSYAEEYAKEKGICFRAIENIKDVDKESDKETNKESNKETDKETNKETYKGSDKSLPRIELDASSKTLYINADDSSYRSFYLTAKVYNSKKTVKFKSSNKAVAKVSKAGLVKAVSKGKAKITAYFKENGTTYQKKCTVKVKNPSLSFQNSPPALKAGESISLKVKAVPAGTVSWRSKNEKIASITQSGLVTGIKEGSTYIYAKANQVEKKLRVTVTGSSITVTPAPGGTDPVYKGAKDAAVLALSSRLSKERDATYVYQDYGARANHFTQRVKLSGIDGTLVRDMEENWQENPFEGSSCIRCEQVIKEEDWGGWMFLNGYLPKGESIPRINDGSLPGQGMDISGADALRFYAKGEKGGEMVEFFTGGFGYAGDTDTRMVSYPDSTTRRSLGEIRFSNQWQEYVIPLSGADLSYIICGFGFVLKSGEDNWDSEEGNAGNKEGNLAFYLDEIRFTGTIDRAIKAPVLVRSYDTQKDYLKDVAFSYDNALIAMAFLSEGRQKESKEILDAFIYAMRQDRALAAAGQEADTGERRIRNAYAAGDISPDPGWESGARLPGRYDRESGAWLEDQTQVGSNVGNTSYVALAFLQYYKAYGGREYLEAACSLMDWVINNCSDSRDGFLGGFDGWEEANPPLIYPLTYKSIEHNIDAYAVFTALYEILGEEKYKEAANSALRFIESMYDPGRGLFMVGTQGDGITPNESVVLDAQVWCAMALGDAFEPYRNAFQTVEAMKVDSGYPFCQENKNGGWWSEGTAFTALMYRERGEEKKYREAMDALVSIQKRSGLFPAATVDNLSTGIELSWGSAWEYSTDVHVAPTAWFIMAVNGFNPYHVTG